MPRIVRPMLVEPDGLPRVGKFSKCLGVREPPNPFADIDVEGGDIVVLNHKGLSVVDDWRRLPGHLIPEHLDDGLNGARGKNMRVFVHGNGAFEEGRVAEGLWLHFKQGSITAGIVAPSASMALEQFQQDLAATRSQWLIDEG